MTVPLCGGVPACSSTCAMMSVVPLTGSALIDDVSVMDDPEGARSGTFSQETVSSSGAINPAATRTAIGGVVRAMIKLVNILSPMHLDGQGGRVALRRSGHLRASEGGYAMAVLLVSISVM